MGMAASQARLLALTARIHDVEYQAQAIQHAKMNLSRISDAASQEYLEILDGHQMTISSLSSGATVQNITATFNNLMGENRLIGSSGQKYAIRNEEGLLVVPDNVYQAYIDFNSSTIPKTADGFASMMMLGGEDAEDDAVIEGMNDPNIVDKNSSSYKYYYEIFQQIKYEGGCVSIEEYDGTENGDAANNGTFLDRKIRTAGWTIEILQNNKKTGEIKLTGTSISSDSALSSTPVSDLDRLELAKAEAKYENTMKQVNSKDKKYDMELSKLETERNALTTQYDSVKKVIEDNVERTFGIFS